MVDPLSSENVTIRALNAAAEVLESDVDTCSNCNYGDGATGKTSEGEPCKDCQDVRESLALVHEALALQERSNG